MWWPRCARLAAREIVARSYTRTSDIRRAPEARRRSGFGHNRGRQSLRSDYRDGGFRLIAGRQGSWLALAHTSSLSKKRTNSPMSSNAKTLSRSEKADYSYSVRLRRRSFWPPKPECAPVPVLRLGSSSNANGQASGRGPSFANTSDGPHPSWAGVALGGQRSASAYQRLRNASQVAVSWLSLGDDTEKSSTADCARDSHT